MEEEFTDLPGPLEVMLYQFLEFLPKIIAASVVFVIGIVLTLIVVNALRRTLERRKVNSEATTVIVRLTWISLIVLTLVVSLQQVGFNLTAFLAGLGILGFTIGFALQDVSKNFVAGVLLLIQQPFNVGETIEVDGFIGKVLEIDLRATRMRTLGGRIVLIPNGDIFTSPIINYSQAEQRRIDIELGVAAESDLGHVRQTVFSAIEGIPGLLEEPAPQVAFHTFGDSTLNCTLYFWIDTSQTNPVNAKDAAVEAVNTTFMREGIELPYPTQTVKVEGVGV
ncbi:MAG: mechanosensitive ion channel [Chloroflexota bacterium]|nr:mechanosensitive ion channel [Chloroflexota bacterium]